MKRTLLFMAEGLQIEGKLQVNLIPASIIGIHSGQTKPTAIEVEDWADAWAAHVWMQNSQEVEATLLLQVVSAVTDQMECLLASNYFGRTQCFHLLLTRKTKPNFYFENLNASHCSFLACPAWREFERLACWFSLTHSVSTPTRRALGLLLLAKFCVCDPHQETWESGSKASWTAELFAQDWEVSQGMKLSAPTLGKLWTNGDILVTLPWPTFFHYSQSMCPLLTTGLSFFKKCSQFLLGVEGELSPKPEFYSPALTPGSVSAHPLSTNEGEASSRRPSHWPRFCLIPGSLSLRAHSQRAPPQIRAP